MKNLKKLDASGISGLNQLGIYGLDLIKLIVWNNSEIIDASWMRNLNELDASRTCGIDQSGINGLNLIKLDVWNNPKIKNVSWMRNLNKNKSSLIILDLFFIDKFKRIECL